MNSVASFVTINSILMLNGANFKACQEFIMIVLSVMDLDPGLKVKRLADLMETSSMMITGI